MVRNITTVLLATCVVTMVLAFGWAMRNDSGVPRSAKSAKQSNSAIPTPQPTPTPTPSPVTLIFAGDVMLDRHIRKHATQRGSYEYILDDLTPLFTSVDDVIVNLEGPVSDNASLSLGSEVGSPRNFLFTFDPESLALLKKNNIKTVNLGNNHILNFGEDGLTQTYQYLTSNSIDYFGNVGSTQQQNCWLLKQYGDLKIAMVNYNQFVPDGRAAVFEDLQEATQAADLAIVYTHWGLEYVQENQVIKNLAYEFVEAGADLIIGSHPHVIQGVEEHQGVWIYYSLGNFVFDQYFEPAVKEGLVVKVQIDQETLEMTFEEFTVQMNQEDGSTTLVR